MPYLRVALASFQRQLAYRAANLAGLGTNIFFGAVYVFVYTALFRGRNSMSGLDLRDTVTYAVITQSLLMVMSAFGNRDLSESIVRGEIATDLSRPVDFYLYWGAIDLGRSLYYLFFRAMPTFLVGLLLFRPRLLQAPQAWALFLAAVLLGMVVSFGFRFIASSFAFWTTDVRGINYLVSTAILFFSGFIVPVNFFPERLREVVVWLPFRSLADLPIQIYLGKIGPAPLLRAMGVEVLWVIGLAALGRLTLRSMVRRLSVQGG